MRPVRRSRRVDQFDKGIVPPRARKVTRAVHPENDPVIADLVRRGDLTAEEVSALGEVRSREVGLQRRSYSHHERSKSIERAISEKTRLQKASQETPTGRRRSHYLGEVATHASKFAEQERVRQVRAGLITEGEEIEAMKEELQAPSQEIETKAVFRKLSPKTESPLEKTGRLSRMRKHWDDSEYEPERASGAIKEDGEAQDTEDLLKSLIDAPMELEKDTKKDPPEELKEEPVKETKTKKKTRKTTKKKS